MISRVAFGLVCLRLALRPSFALPPIRAIRTGLARRPRYRKSRSPRCGPVLRSAMPMRNGRTIPKSAALVEKVAARRTPLDDAQKAITDFLSAPGTDKVATGKLLFAGLFEQLNAERSSVMSGLERVTRKQRQAADKIRGDTMALQALQDATPRDQAKVDELGNHLGLGDADLRRPPSRRQIRLRGADHDRSAAVCTWPHHPAGNRIALG